MKITEKNTHDLIPYENNPRNNDDAVEYVINSIKEFGFKVPIVIDKNNVIVAGHTRLKAAEKMGIEKVPCIIASDLTEEQIKAFRLADNKTAEIATWDFDKLELELSELPLEMDLFGFIESESEQKEETKEEKDLSDSVKSDFEVIVECKDEFEQEEIFNRLRDEGYTCRVLTL